MVNAGIGSGEPSNGVPVAAGESNQSGLFQGLAEVFQAGKVTLTNSEAVASLMERVGCMKSTAYASIKANGRFKHRLREVGGRLEWTAQGQVSIPQPP